MRFLLPLPLLLGACTLHQASRVTETLAIGSLACDGGTTIQFRSHGVPETNPFLGPAPDAGDVVIYMAAVSGLVVLAHEALPDWLAIPADLAVIGVEARSVHINDANGASGCGLGPWNGPEAAAWARGK